MKAEENMEQPKAVMGGLGKTWELTHQDIRRSQITLRRKLMDGSYEALGGFEKTYIKNSADRSLRSSIFTRSIDGDGPCIIASTPSFRKEFNYSSEDLYMKDLKEFFRVPGDAGNIDCLVTLCLESSPRRISLPIFLGGKEEFLAYLSIDRLASIDVPTHFFKSKKHKTYDYSEIEICNIGTFERNKNGEFRRRGYHSFKKPKTIYQQRVNQIVKALEKVKGGRKRTTLWNLDRNIKTEFEF